MKPLPTAFNRHGWSYAQIWRKKDVAVFEYSSRGGSFELVIIRDQPNDITMHDGTVVAAREIYPSSNQWGQYGWTLGPKDREFALWARQTNCRFALFEANSDDSRAYGPVG